MKIPSTVEQFVNEFIECAGEEQCRAAIKKYGKNFDVSNFHHGLGQNIRNDFSLWYDDSGDLKADLWDKIGALTRRKYNKHWAECAETKDQYQGRNMHGDDASHELLRYLWAEMVRRFK